MSHLTGHRAFGVSDLLEKFKAKSGLADRKDLQTFFEYWEVDEGRKK